MSDESNNYCYKSVFSQSLKINGTDIDLTDSPLARSNGFNIDIEPQTGILEEVILTISTRNKNTLDARYPIKNGSRGDRRTAQINGD